MLRRKNALLLFLATVLSSSGCGLASDGLGQAEPEPDATPEPSTGQPRDAAPRPAPDAGSDGRSAPVPVSPDASRPDTQTLPLDAGDAATLPAPRDAAPDVPTVTAPPGWVGRPAIVAVGYGGRRLHSRDGVTWTGDMQDARTSAESPALFRDVAYAAGLVVAVGGACTPRCAGRLATFDGERWTEVTLPAGQSWLGGVAHGAGTWVAVGATGPGLVSPDGKRWTQTRPLPGTLRRVSFGRVGGTSQFVAVGDNGLRVRSVDGQTWTHATHGFPGSESPVTLSAVAIGNGTVVAAGTGGRRIRSTDGIAWSDAAAGGSTIGSVVFVDGKFMAYDAGVVHISSDDGRTWSPQTLVTSSPVDAVATGLLGGARLFVGLSAPASIKTSSNGLAWSTAVRGDEQQNPLTRFVFAGY